jgi:PadR family transcriptional regulator, regulatory protein PadR
MRRKPGALLPLELAICTAARDITRRRHKEFHGYEIAKHLTDVGDSRLLVAYGTLYRALGRLEDMGMLESRWEDPEVSASENRPRRRLYSLTALGATIVLDAGKAAKAKSRKQKWAPA